MKKLLHLKAILLTLCLSLVGGGMTVATAQTVVFHETFDKCDGTGGGDDQWKGNVASAQITNELDTWTDVPGWTGVRVYKGAQSIKLGTGDNPGSITSPALGFSGAATLTLKARAWNKDNKVVNLSLSEGTLSQTEVELNNAEGETWNVVNIEITDATPSSQLTISAMTGDNRFFIDDVTISVNESGKEAAGLSFGEETRFTVDLSGTFTAPALTKTTDAAATYTSSETSVATVDASTGAVALVGAGTTTITATTPETDAYMAGSASYTLTVIDLSAMAKFQKVTTITSGKRYLIAVENSGELVVAQPIPATGNPYGYLNVNTPDATDAEGNLYMADLANAFTITAVEGGYYIQQADGRYFYQTGKFDSFNVGSAGDNAIWTIEPQADGTFTITNVAMNKYVQFNPNYNSFGSYADKQDGAILPVLYEEVGGKEAPEFSFAAQTATLNLLDAEAFTAPALNSTSDGAVTYTSSNPEVATIDADGRIEALAQGTTTITATVAETDEFTAATAEFTLHVTTLSDYMKTTAVESGKTYILAADNEGTAVIAQTVAANSRYDYLPVNEAAPADLMGATDLLNGFTLTETEGGYTIQDAYGRYLYMDETHTSFNVSADRQDGDTWTVEPQADGTVKITNVLREKFIQYSTEHESYGAYTDEQGIKPSLYVKNSIEVNEDGYATAYSDNAVILPEGLQAAVITGVADGKLTIDYRYNSGDVIPAGTAVLVKGEAGAHDYNLATSDEQAVAGNLLRGAASDVNTEGDGCLFYMLSYDANHQNLGFYWAAKDGAAFTSKAGKAYLALPQAASAGVTGYALDGTPVGIDQATTDAQAPAVIYTVDGRLVQQTDVKDLPKGLYIVNGKKVIIK